MGILRLGEKRFSDPDGTAKVFKVNKIGWRRIAKNAQRFGWIGRYEDENGKYKRADNIGKFKVLLGFSRLDSERDSQPSSVRVLESIYNVFFLIRRIAAFFLPIIPIALIVLGIVAVIIPSVMGIMETVLKLFVAALVIWIACIILEGIFARIAASKISTGNTKKTIVANHNKNANIGGKATYQNSGNDDDFIVTLTTAKGEEIDFEEIAGINYRGKYYAILRPVELLEGMEENEALVFEVYRGASGEDKFEVVLDDAIIDAVFVEYNKLLDEAEGKR